MKQLELSGSLISCLRGSRRGYIISWFACSNGSRGGGGTRNQGGVLLAVCSWVTWMFIDSLELSQGEKVYIAQGVGGFVPYIP